MTDRRRTPLAAPGARVLSVAGVLLTVLIPVLLTVVAPAPTAVAADRDLLRTTITSITPSHLTGKAKVTLSGRVTNLGEKQWTDAQAYLIVRPVPLTTRSGLASAVRDDPGFAGPRAAEVGLFDEIGDLTPGSTRDFTVTVPAARLPISGAEGVYPIGVQILATDSSGNRSNDSVSRAVTLLPRMSADHAAAPTTIVWPFLMPTGRGATGEFIDVKTLTRAIGPGGQLRNLLDLAVARGGDGRGVIVDPALVLAADDLAAGRGAKDVSNADQQAAARFRDDLVSISSGPSAWVLDFDRTDVLSLVDGATRRRRLFGAVERTTDTVVQQFGLSRQRVSWPLSGDVTRGLLGTLRGRGDDPAIVSSSDLSNRTDTAGSLIDFQTAGGALPLLVDDDITAGLPGLLSGATLRQEVLAAAAFASLSRDKSPASEATAVVIVDPRWFPASDDPVGPASASWAADFRAPTDLDAVARDPSFEGSVSRTTKAKKLPAALLDAADEAYRTGDLFSSASNNSRSVEDDRARSLANVLGVRWRTNRAEGTQQARRLARRLDQDLQAVSVMGPPSVTLSSSRGAFPLTITNKSARSVSVGVRLSSSNRALQLPDQEPVKIGAGERLTVTVDLDLRQQNATTVAAQLITPDGRAFGSTSEFNVRSSRVGSVLWATMAAAGLFVLVALVRRFRKRRSDRPSMDPVVDDE